jgi:hypothetical protein
LARGLVHVDMNMVGTGVVRHPREWAQGGVSPSPWGGAPLSGR